MFVDELPKKKIGYLSPRTAVENQAYEFYRLAPPGIMLVIVASGLEKFTAGDVKRITKTLNQRLDMLVERQVDIIAQTGVPLPLLVGIEAHDALIKHIADYTGIPATTQLENVIAAMKHLKLKNVLVANKWTDGMNAMLEAFLDREGISVAGVYNKSLAPKVFTKIPTKDSAKLAYDLGKKAFKEHPEADALYIGGGNWLSQPVCEQLEAEIGKPVIGNLGSFVWTMLHRLRMWRPLPGHGLLLEGRLKKPVRKTAKKTAGKSAGKRTTKGRK